MNQADFQETFDQAVATWRHRYHIRDDDLILLCLELFRIHQEHWDQIRKQDFPSFEECRDTILKLGETAAQIRQHSTPLVEELRRHQDGGKFAPPTITAILFAVTLAFVLGVLIGKLFL